jgi:hypothetical protein
MGKCFACFLNLKECSKSSGKYCTVKAFVKGIKDICFMCGLRGQNHWTLKNSRITNSGDETGNMCGSIAKDVMLPVIWYGRRSQWNALAENFKIDESQTDEQFKNWLYDETIITGFSNHFFVFEFLKKGVF